MVELRICKDDELKVLARGQAAFAFIVKDDEKCSCLPFSEIDGNVKWPEFMKVCENLHKLTGALLEIQRKEKENDIH